MKSLTYKFISISIFASVLLLLSGCGSGDGSSTVVGVGGGTYVGNGIPQYSQSWCQYGADGNFGYGTVDQLPSYGYIRCTKAVLNPNYSVSGNIRLSPASGPYSAVTPSSSSIYAYDELVLPGDLLYYQASGTSGNYKASQCSTAYTGDGASSFTANLYGVDITTGAGSINNGYQYQYGGYNAGFVALIGGTYYSLGTNFYGYVSSISGSNVSIGGTENSGNGPMYVGINSPCPTNTDSFTVQYFVHQHCEDVNGNTQECPQDGSTN